MKKSLPLAVALLISTTVLHAQQPDSAPRTLLDSLYARARQLVLEGNGAAGRALVDSLVNATLPGSPGHVDALFWRASLAGTASDAERDYRRIIVEYPLSARAGEALFSLAQLEIARGDRENAAAHLQRFLLDHPESSERSRAAVSLGRMLIEQGRMARGCAVIGRARAGVPADAVELRNQMDYYAQRCDGVDTVEAVVANAAPANAAPATAPTSVPATPRIDTARPAAPQARQAATVPPTAPKPQPAAPTKDSTAPKTVAARDTNRQPATASAPTRDTVKKIASAAPTRDTAAKKTTTSSPTPTRDTATRKAPTSVPAPAAAQRFTVQVAAFDTKGEADQLVDRLKKRGLAARVSGTARPFRVRIGRYANETAAADVLKTLRAQGMNGFVTPAEPEAR